MSGVTEVRKRFLSHITELAPDLSTENLDERVSPQLVSPFVVDLPAHVLEDARRIATAAFRLRSHPDYVSSLEPRRQELGLIDPGHYSIMMSFDFHLNDQGKLQLIEINTNAAFLILGHLLYQAQGITPAGSFQVEDIRKDIENELALWRKAGGKTSAEAGIAIVDENPPAQRLFIEFLVYRSLFRQWNWRCDILDRRDVSADYPFIYNRVTDFYLTEPESKNLRELFVERRSCLSPNPFEYLCLADKERLIEWKLKPDWIRSLIGEDADILLDALLDSEVLVEDNREALWADRKSRFFKPLQSFGSKQSYRGESISRKTFESFPSGGFVAQKFVPAPEATFSLDGESHRMKYDLRFFAYMDRLQLGLARLYQGQVTNLRTPLGGFACLRFQ